MTSPGLPYDTYRLTNIPSHVRLDEVRGLLKDDVDIVASSLAPALLPYYEGTQVATITLSKKSTVLSEASNAGYLPSSIDGQKIKIDNHFRGFTPLNAVAENQETVDVIAVTGLAGKAFGSWQCSDGRMWLRDFLPRGVASCRVTIFGYDSTLFKSESQATIHDFTNEFIRNLEITRPSDPDRPIILIGHSLGCLILINAFVILSNKPGGRLSRLIHSMFFFGAPYRGYNTEPLLKIIKEKPPRNLVRDMEEGSSFLKHLNSQFPALLKNRRIVTIYELQRSPTTIEKDDEEWSRDGPPAMAVKPHSACLNIQNEELISSNLNHSMIAKLSDDSDSAYHHILKLMKEDVKAALEITRQRLQEEPIRTGPKLLSNSLPRPQDKFLGRDFLLQDLRKISSEARIKPSIMVLHGIGGGGKSQIARHYTHEHQKDYRAVFWVDFRSQVTIKQGFDEAAESIRNTFDRAIKTSAIESVKSWLEQCREPWLLILDNVDDGRIAPRLRDKYLPSRGIGEIIITTRNRVLSGIGYQLNVPSLDLEDAAELLLRITGQQGQALPEAKEISSLLGGLPLAVVQAGAYIKELQIPMNVYVDLYRNQDKRKDCLSYKSPLSPDEENTAATTFEISFKHLKEKNRSAAWLLLLFSFLDRSISFGILELAFKRRSSPDDAQSKLPPWLLSTGTANGDWNQHTLYEHTAPLHSLSLIDQSDGSRAPTVCSMHPVVQECSHFRLSLAQQKEYVHHAIRFVHRASLQLQEDMTTDMSAAFVKHKPLLPHINSCLENSERYLTKSDFWTKSDCLGGPGSKKAALRFSHLFRYNGNWETAQMLQQRVLDNLPNHDPLYIEATLALCSTLRKRDKSPEAALLLSRLEPLVKAQPERRRLLSQLADTSRDLGQLQDACRDREAMLATSRSTEGENSHSNLNDKSALAVIYSRLRRYDDALSLEVEVLEQRQKLSGKSHGDTLTAMANLAMSYYDKGDFKRIVKMERDVLDGRRKLFGPDNVDTIRAKGSLGATLRKLGEYPEAVRLLKEALNSKIAMMGAKHQSTEKTYRHLHSAYRETGNHEEEENLERSFRQAQLSS